MDAKTLADSVDRYLRATAERQAARQVAADARLEALLARLELWGVGYQSLTSVVGDLIREVRSLNDRLDGVGSAGGYLNAAECPGDLETR